MRTAWHLVWIILGITQLILMVSSPWRSLPGVRRDDNEDNIPLLPVAADDPTVGGTGGQGGGGGGGGPGGGGGAIQFVQLACAMVPCNPWDGVAWWAEPRPEHIDYDGDAPCSAVPLLRRTTQRVATFAVLALPGDSWLKHKSLLGGIIFSLNVPWDAVEKAEAFGRLQVDGFGWHQDAHEEVCVSAGNARGHKRPLRPGPSPTPPPTPPTSPPPTLPPTNPSGPVAPVAPVAPAPGPAPSPRRPSAFIQQPAPTPSPHRSSTTTSAPRPPELGKEAMHIVMLGNAAQRHSQAQGRAIIVGDPKPGVMFTHETTEGVFAVAVVGLTSNQNYVLLYHNGTEREVGEHELRQLLGRSEPDVLQYFWNGRRVSLLDPDPGAKSKRKKPKHCRGLVEIISLSPFQIKISCDIGKDKVVSLPDKAVKLLDDRNLQWTYHEPIPCSLVQASRALKSMASGWSVKTSAPCCLPPLSHNAPKFTLHQQKAPQLLGHRPGRSQNSRSRGRPRGHQRNVLTNLADDRDGDLEVSLLNADSDGTGKESSTGTTFQFDPAAFISAVIGSASGFMFLRLSDDAFIIQTGDFFP